MTFCAISRWQPMASIVTMAPSIASMSSSFGIAMISLWNFFRNLDLPENEALAQGGEGRNHVDGAFRIALFA